MQPIVEQLKEFFASRRATTLLYVLLFFSFSWLSYGVYLRVDLSSTGAMRISSTSKNLLRSLPEKATIELFASSDLPDEAVLVARKARDFIQEYANSSRGKVKLIVLDPDSDKSAAERARSLGLQQLNIAVTGSKKAQAQSVYFGLAISYGSKTEILNNLISLFEQQELENHLTARIFKMVKPNEKRIALLAGHGPFTLKKERNPNSLSIFADKVSAFYNEIIETNPSTGEIPVEVSTLIIVQPGSLSALDKFRIDQFLMRGGNLIIAASGMEVNFSQQFMAAPANPDLTEFLKGYGIELASDLIHEPKKNHYVPFVQPISPFQVVQYPYPPWVVVPRDGLSQESLITKGNAALIMPYTSSIKTIPDKLPTGEGKFTVEILAKSSADAWSQANFAFLDPGRMEEMLSTPKQNTGVYNLAIFVRGKFPSQYATQAPPKEAGTSWLKAAEKEGSILVLGSPFVFSNLTYILGEMTGLPLLEENFKTIFAAIDVMHGNQDLVELRKKAKPNIKTRMVEDALRRILTFLAFALPLGVIGVTGFLRLYRRQSRARSEEIPATAEGAGG
ncbi:MAG: GldG family protein [Turneriella sp.]|nr:GldG family protein [Turneriella sp.]